MGRRWWRGGSQSGPGADTARLQAALAAGDQATALTCCRRLLAASPRDLGLLRLAAELVLALPARRGSDPRREAAAWLRQAHELAPGDVGSLCALAELAGRDGQDAAAEEWWRQAMVADPDDPRPQHGLLELWRRRGEVPAWGVPWVERAYLTAPRDELWRLLVPAWRQLPELSADGFRLLLRRFQEGQDRQPVVVERLAAELELLGRHDEVSREVFAALGATSRGQLGVARCDARTGRYRAAALPAYQAAWKAGDNSGALLLAAATVRGDAAVDRAVAAALWWSASRASDAELRPLGLQREQLLLRAATWVAAQPPTPAGAAVVAAASTAQPDEPRWPRYLLGCGGAVAEQAAWRVLQLDSGDAANHARLAAAVLAGEWAPRLDDRLWQLAPAEQQAPLLACLARHAWQHDRPRALPLLRELQARQPADPMVAARLFLVAWQAGQRDQPPPAGDHPTLTALQALWRSSQGSGTSPALAAGLDHLLSPARQRLALAPLAAATADALPAAHRLAQSATPWRLLASDSPSPADVPGWRAAWLELAVRTAPPEELRPWHPQLTRDQRRRLELRRVAAALDTDDPAASTLLEALAPALDTALADDLRGLLALTAACQRCRRGEPVGALEVTARYAEAAAWVRFWSLPGDDPAAWAALPEALRLNPAAVLALLPARPHTAAVAVPQALRRCREHAALQLAWAGLAARQGDASRFALAAGPLRGGPHEPALAAVEAVLSGPLTALPTALEPLAQAAAGAHLREGQVAAAAAALAAHQSAAASNLRAAAQLAAGDGAAAAATLEALPASPAVWHNRAIVAERSGDLAAAAAARELALSAGEPVAVRAAAHDRLARLYRRLGQPAPEVAHLEALLLLRPDHHEALRASLQPLLDLGRGEEAVQRSELLLRQAGDDLAVQLDHAAVLATAHGAAAAGGFLAGLELRQPDRAVAVREQRLILQQRLLDACRERRVAGDWLGLFAAARDAAKVALEPVPLAQAWLHQVTSLGNLAREGEAVARLDQALARCDEALALELPAELVASARQLRREVAERLAPALLSQADELGRTRLAELQALAAAPAGAARSHQAVQMVGTFERLQQLIGRAVSLDPRLAAQAADRQEAARRLRERAAALAAPEVGDAP
ncbi:MAG: hypothetical protein IT204_24835 [Fimbriimonadaceae bacterium]|nr:hypothetical protein [Fimbriimonadaceae bacterium]